jgi:large subunit ribosomal protein L7e
MIRKRGFLNKEEKRLPLQNNALIEELLGDKGVICVEDIIETLVKCEDESLPFDSVKKVIWPIQLAPLKEDSKKGNLEKDASGKEYKKKNSKVVKGGYLGMMGDKVNDFVRPLI